MIETPSQPHAVTSTSCGIAVMAKASTPGLTKTRLVPPLTYGEAAAFNTAFLKDVAANIIAAGVEAEIAGYMAFGPPGSEPFFRENLPPSIGLIEAWRPDFGDCLFTAIDQMLRVHGAAVVKTRHVALRREPIVLQKRERSALRTLGVALPQLVLIDGAQ